RGAAVPGARARRPHRARHRDRARHAGSPGHRSDGRQRLGTARGYLAIAVLLRSALLALAERRAVGDALDRLALSRRAPRRFVAGTTAEDALTVVARLNAHGLKGAVTFLGER